MSVKADDFAERYRLLAIDCANAIGDAERLEHVAKRKFSELVNQSNAGSVAKAENEARVNPFYEAAKMAEIDGRTRANVLRARLDAMKVQFELYRTESATRRAEMTLK